MATALSSSCVSKVWVIPSVTRRLQAPRTLVGPPASIAASSAAFCSGAPSGTSQFTKPQAWASSAVKMRLV